MHLGLGRSHVRFYILTTLNALYGLYRDFYRILDEASDEKRLARTLLRNYKLVGKIGRPVKNSSHPILLKFGMGLISMNVEEKENMLSLSVWTKLVMIFIVSE